jgi:glycosyltransferase involved in cell wall biosynthesis
MESAKQPPLVIVTGDFVRTGGQDYANFALARFLAERSRDVHLVGYRFDESLESRRNVHLHRVPKPANAYTFGAPLLGAAGLLMHERLRRQGARLIANGGNCIARSLNWVHYVHAAYQPRSTVFSQRARELLTRNMTLLTERVALRGARVIIANSERTKRDIVDLVGVDRDRVKTVYYGVDPDRFRIATNEERNEAARALDWKLDRFRVAFIGALGDRRKGFDVLFDAWCKLSETAGWDGQLVVVGAGAEVDLWRARVKQKNLEDSILILGFRSDVPRILSACDALVSPTRYEAYGLGVHEALCCGLPAIVSADAGVAERYPENLKHLLLHDLENPEHLAALLVDLRKDLATTKDRVRALSDDLRKRTWDVMASEIEALCDVTR